MHASTCTHNSEEQKPASSATLKRLLGPASGFLISHFSRPRPRPPLTRNTGLIAGRVPLCCCRLCKCRAVSCCAVLCCAVLCSALLYTLQESAWKYTSVGRASTAELPACLPRGSSHRPASDGIRSVLIPAREVHARVQVQPQPRSARSSCSTASTGYMDTRPTVQLAA